MHFPTHERAFQEFKSMVEGTMIWATDKQNKTKKTNKQSYLTNKLL
jgi:hypothetical protein